MKLSWCARTAVVFKPKKESSFCVVVYLSCQQMRRNITTYFTILLASCIFYFGSLYIVSRTSSNTATSVSSSCYSVMHASNELDAQSIQENNQHQSSGPILDHTNDTPRPSLSESTHTPWLPPNSTLQIEPSTSLSTTQHVTSTISTSKRANAVIVILCRNNELNAMRRTLREFEE